MKAKRTKGLNIEVFNHLRDLLGPKKVSRSPIDQISYSRDQWRMGQIWMRNGEVPYQADFIIWPETADEVSKVINLCNDARIPLIPFGAGSGLCGGTVPLTGGIICDLKRMNRVDSINDKSLLVTAQCGIIGEHLERELSHAGYTLGHFPSSIYCSTLGGYLATRSAGQFSTKYGKIEDLLVSMQVVLPNGEIVHTRTAPRSATGPDFDQLLMGTEGTLGIITRATLKVRPKSEGLVFSAFDFDKLEKGAEAVRRIMQTGITPAVVRLYDEKDAQLAMSAIDENHNKGALLLLIFEGGPRRCEMESEISFDICKAEGGIPAGRHLAETWWKRRYALNYMQSKILPEKDMVLDTIEVAASWTALLPLYREMIKVLSARLNVHAHFTHAYREGCSISFMVMGKASGISDTEDRKSVV